MRIGFVARRWWPAIGGVESFARHVAHGLAIDHDVIVVAHRIDEGPPTRLTDSLRPPPSFTPFSDDGVEVVPLHIGRARRAMLTPLLTQVTPGLRRYAYGRMRGATSALYSAVVGPVVAATVGDIDVLHMWGGDQVASAALAAARARSVPLVVTPFAHEAEWGDDAASAAVYRSADAVIALQRTEAALYERLGVAPERIHVCGACSPGLEPGGGDRLREAREIDGPLVVFVGVRRPYKGFDVLLRAAPLVARHRPDTTFAFVGPGPAIAASDACPRIIDAGEVDEEEHADWIDAADLLCLPSRSELFGIVLLEAWSVGTPVLTSAIPALQDLVDRSGGGATAPLEIAAFAEAITRLLDDPARLAALGRAGRDFWTASHTVEAVTNAHERVYESVVR